MDRMKFTNQDGEHSYSWVIYGDQKGCVLFDRSYRYKGHAKRRAIKLESEGVRACVVSRDFRDYQVMFGNSLSDFLLELAAWTFVIIVNQIISMCSTWRTWDVRTLSVSNAKRSGLNDMVEFELQPWMHSVWVYLLWVLAKRKKLTLTVRLEEEWNQRVQTTDDLQSNVVELVVGNRNK